tara:strand:- start:277 stop:618 length:342 start_codon:yes stop_codon:yes gene_type:complete
MDALLEQRDAIKKGKKPIKLSSKSESFNILIENLNKYSFGYIGTIAAIIYNSILEKGILGSVYELFKSSFFFVKKTQRYPNKLLHNIFSFVSEPLERIIPNSTKNTSKQPLSK